VFSLAFKVQLGLAILGARAPPATTRRMSSALTAPSSDRRRAHKSLEGWWSLMGVESPPAVPAPPTPAATATAAAPAAPQPAPEAERPEMNGPALAAGADSLEALKDALSRFEGCALKATASNLVFSRGTGSSGIMVVGEAPGREEDEQGEPFVGRSGRLLDAMFAAIGVDRDALYVTNIVNWRPPGNRKPTDEEIEACRPFILRHIALKQPKALVLAGGVSASTLLRTNAGIMSIRGRWQDVSINAGAPPIPALPVFHPAFLLRTPANKAKAWADMLALKHKLEL